MSKAAMDRIVNVSVLQPELVSDPEGKVAPTQERVTGKPIEYKYENTADPEDAKIIEEDLTVQDQLPDAPPQMVTFLERFSIFQRTTFDVLGVMAEPSAYSATWECIDEMQRQVNRLEHFKEYGVMMQAAIDYAEEHHGPDAMANLWQKQQKALPSSAPAEAVAGTDPINVDERRDTLLRFKDDLAGLGAEEVATKIISMVRSARTSYFIDRDLVPVRDTIELCEIALDTHVWVSGDNESRRKLGSAGKRLQNLRSDTINRLENIGR